MLQVSVHAVDDSEHVGRCDNLTSFSTADDTQQRVLVGRVTGTIVETVQRQLNTKLATFSTFCVETYLSDKAIDLTGDRKTIAQLCVCWIAAAILRHNYVVLRFFTQSKLFSNFLHYVDCFLMDARPEKARLMIRKKQNSWQNNCRNGWKMLTKRRASEL